MTRWTIYKVAHDAGWHQSLKKLGVVEAPHQPRALLIAFERWPDQTNWRQAQAGFTAIPRKRR